MNQNLSNFFLCGSAGWCLEILWTGLHSLLDGQRTMNGKTSLLMFPIYGCAAVIAPLYARIYTFPLFYRGLLLYVWLLSGGIFKWKHSQTVQHVSMGLQRCSFSVSWNHPS